MDFQLITGSQTHPITWFLRPASHTTTFSTKRLLPKPLTGQGMLMELMMSFFSQEKVHNA
jgi:hypothetical protein